MDQDATRRRVVGALGGVVGTALAGCSSTDGGIEDAGLIGDDDDDGSEGGNGTEAADGTEMPGDADDPQNEEGPQSADDDEWVVTRETADTVIERDTIYRVEVEGHLLAVSEVTLGGSIQAGGQVVLEDEVTAERGVEAGAILVTGADVDVDGHVRTTDTAVLGADIAGTREVHRERGLRRISDLQVATAGHVGGQVRTDQHLLVAHEASVEGTLTAGGEGGAGGNQYVVLGRNVDVDGDVRATGDVVIGPDSEVEGDVHSGGTVHLGDDADVDGEIQAENVEQGERADVWGSG